MTWITRSSKEMQKIIDISTEFYELNDIEINSKKSELLVLNWKDNKLKSSNSLEVRMRKSREVIQAKRGKEAIRHLGVWISEKNRKECNESIIIKEVARMCKAIL